MVLKKASGTSAFPNSSTLNYISLMLLTGPASSDECKTKARKQKTTNLPFGNTHGDDATKHNAKLQAD